MADKPAPILSACGEPQSDPIRCPRVLYRGREVLLCSVDCLKQYKADPEAFMRGDVVHTNSSKRTLVDQTTPK